MTPAEVQTRRNEIDSLNKSAEEVRILVGAAYGRLYEGRQHIRDEISELERQLGDLEHMSYLAGRDLVRAVGEHQWAVLNQTVGAELAERHESALQ